MMRSLGRVVIPTLALWATTACSDKLLIPQYNAPTVAGVNSSSQGLQLYATGVLLSLRGSEEGYVKDVSVFGREGYQYFPTDARSVSHYLIGLPGPGGTRLLDPAGFASGNWYGHFRNMRNAVNMMSLLAGNSGIPAGQKAAVNGFARTIWALELWYIIATRDSLGAPITIPDNPATPAPFATRDAVYSGISALLDQAKADLQSAGGTPFPFTLHSGFSGFDTPGTFLKFNRALAARVLAERGSLGCGTCYAQALTELQASFIQNPATLADLNTGVYSVYSTAAGDALNGMNINVDNNYFAHASAWNNAQKKADGTPDDRVVRKMAFLAKPRPAPGTNNGIAATMYYIMYPSTTSPVPLIRNEELLLIRAEAEIQTNATAAALADINTIRTVSGGLAPLASLGADPIGTLLTERWVSLLDEGHRWIDMRRFHRLNQLPLDLPSHFVAIVMPIPTQECNARSGSLLPPTGC